MLFYSFVSLSSPASVREMWNPKNIRVPFSERHEDQLIERTFLVELSRCISYNLFAEELLKRQ